MKKTLSVVIRVLSVLYALLPTCSLVAYCFGYTISLFNYAVFSAALAAFSVFSTVLVFVKRKNNAISKADKIMLTFLPLLAIINWAVYLFKSNEHAVIAVCMPLCFSCSVILSIKHTKPLLLKTISIALPFLAVIPIVFLNLLMLTPMHKNTVVNTVPSPKGTCYAEIVDSDHGAMGGNTVVYIYKNKGIDLFAFSITKARERVYMGEWKEYETMKLYWESENCLIINSEEYIIE